LALPVGFWDFCDGECAKTSENRKLHILFLL
jgi:hypothetical protein